MRQFKPLILLVALIAGAMLWQRHVAPANTAGSAAMTPVVAMASISTGSTVFPSASVLASMPPEVRATLVRIAGGGPFEHAQDGAVFGNYERLLPPQPRGYYHEYTVATPGAHDRGARRIVAGGSPPVVYYYTEDHYRSFRRFESGQ
jgi:ribonuclease T1